MSIETHLAELERRHRALDAEIAEARAHPSVDDLQIVELKRRKLLVKDEIARLQALITDPNHATGQTEHIVAAAAR